MVGVGVEVEVGVVVREVVGVGVEVNPVVGVGVDVGGCVTMTVVLGVGVITPLKATSDKSGDATP